MEHLIIGIATHKKEIFNAWDVLFYECAPGEWVANSISESIKKFEDKWTCRALSLTSYVFEDELALMYFILSNQVQVNKEYDEAD